MYEQINRMQITAKKMFTIFSVFNILFSFNLIKKNIEYKNIQKKNCFQCPLCSHHHLCYRSAKTIKKHNDNIRDNDIILTNKAKKYHNKIQKQLHEMMAQGKACPKDYEKYLQPFGDHTN